MKTTTKLLAVCTALTISSVWAVYSQLQQATTTQLNVDEMKSVPDGHYLVNLEFNGQQITLNLETKDNSARCVKSSDPKLQDMQGKFVSRSRGVFEAFFQKDSHRQSQIWIFRKDGTASVREVPDRGERQIAVPVPNDFLERPKQK